MADYEDQIELEKITNKNQTMPRLRAIFGQELFINHMQENLIPIDFGVDLLCQIALHRRANFKTMFGLMVKHFGTSEEALQRCADMLTRAFEVDLCDYDIASGEFIVVHEIPQDVQRDLDRFQYPMPMVVQPKKLRHNKSSAYLTSGGSVILKGYNHHDDDVNLDHLNRANKVKLTLNQETARLVENAWSDLDKQKEDETWEEYQKRVEAFRKYDENARGVMELITLAGNEFHMTYKYDKRGRTYAQGHHINPQGNAWNKAVIEFADKEVIE